MVAGPTGRGLAPRRDVRKGAWAQSNPSEWLGNRDGSSRGSGVFVSARMRAVLIDTASDPGRQSGTNGAVA